MVSLKNETIAVKCETIMRREMNQKIPYWSFPFSDSSSGVDLIFSSSTFPTACSPSGLQNASISSLNSGFSLWDTAAFRMRDCSTIERIRSFQSKGSDPGQEPHIQCKDRSLSKSQRCRGWSPEQISRKSEIGNSLEQIAKTFSGGILFPCCTS